MIYRRVTARERQTRGAAIDAREGRPLAAEDKGECGRFWLLHFCIGNRARLLREFHKIRLLGTNWARIACVIM